MVPDNYDKRAISIGGYGSLVPFHGIHSYDPAQPGKSVTVNLPVADGWASPNEILQFIEKVETHLDVKTDQGQLFYTLQYSDYSFHASGIENLADDLRNAFTLGEELKGTLESRYSQELRMHRPCFVILAPIEYGLFYLFLRGGKSYSDQDESEWEIVYDWESGVLMDSPVLTWPNLEKMVQDNKGRPVPQRETEVASITVRGDQQDLQEVYPLDQEETGDADIIAAKNPFTFSDIESQDEEVRDAIDRTQHLTYRVRGGTVGFDKEDSYTIKSMSVLKPDNLSLWGHQLAICSPMCNAHSSD
ncbi:hypothetical protein [Natronosalvus amylolyticus]|uniref:hypothetical protein n=1 Tax=Natronosalvus amylolyticus TaxID=2961994 RepID=UPI0020C93CF2|nr:hypothetical protein [Natronosalvus amylolyticus]